MSLSVMDKYLSNQPLTQNIHHTIDFYTKWHAILQYKVSISKLITTIKFNKYIDLLLLWVSRRVCVDANE